jgi:hypothetical protein
VPQGSEKDARRTGVDYSFEATDCSTKLDYKTPSVIDLKETKVEIEGPRRACEHACNVRRPSIKTGCVASSMQQPSVPLCGTKRNSLIHR